MEQIKIELQKAKLEVEPEYSFEFMGWKFNRTLRRWDVETIHDLGIPLFLIDYGPHINTI